MELGDLLLEVDGKFGAEMLEALERQEAKAARFASILLLAGVDVPARAVCGAGRSRRLPASFEMNMESLD